MKSLVLFCDNVLFDFPQAVVDLYGEFTGENFNRGDWPKMQHELAASPALFTAFAAFCIKNADVVDLEAAKGMQRLVDRTESLGYGMAVLTKVGNNGVRQSRYLQSLWCHYGNRLSQIICYKKDTLGEVLTETTSGYDKVVLVDANPMHLAQAKETVHLPVWLENPYYRDAWYKISQTGITVVKDLRGLYRLLLK